MGACFLCNHTVMPGDVMTGIHCVLRDKQTFFAGWRMGETLFSLGEVSCDLCWCLCNVDHWEEAKEKVSDWF